MKINKGDIILIIILLATFAMFGITEFNIINGYEQLESSAWTAFIAIFGGELLTFCLYKVGKAKYQPKDTEEIEEENIDEN